MTSERTEELYRLLLSKGYQEELCREIAYQHMNTDYTATRMLGYLYRDVYKRQSMDCADGKRNGHRPRQY